MTSLDKVFITCDDDDFPALESFQLPVSVIRIKELIKLSQASVSDDDFINDKMILNFLGSVHFTPSGVLLGNSLAKHLKKRIDNLNFKILDLTETFAALSSEDIKNKVTNWILNEMISVRGSMAQRNVMLRRELSSIRKSHESTQLSFERLEAFLWKAFAAPRWHTLTLEPLNALLPRVLSSGSRLTQRIPNDTSGLSDVAVFISNINSIGAGVLTAQLEASESGALLSEWQVNSAEFDSTGWVRFSMLRSIGLDKQTLILHLAWSGEIPIEIACSVAHPDSRFHSFVDSIGVETVIALKCWKYIEGVLAPLPSDGHVALDRVNLVLPKSRRVFVDKAKLSMVTNLDPTLSEVAFDPDRNGILVHPPKEGIAIGRIDNCFNYSITQVSASIETVNERSQHIEYCIALADKRLRDLEKLDDASFIDMTKSEWISLRPNYSSQIHLYLPEINHNSFDLYLMTRLPVGCNDNAFGWAIFKEISAIT